MSVFGYKGEKIKRILHFGDCSFGIDTYDKNIEVKVDDSNTDSVRKIKTYNIIGEESGNIARVQCSVKYVIVLFFDTSTGFLYNKRTGIKEFFSFSCKKSTKDNLYIESFRIDKYIIDGYTYTFDYAKNDTLENITIQNVDSHNTARIIPATKGDIPIICMDNILMHQKGGLIYEEKTA